MKHQKTIIIILTNKSIVLKDIVQNRIVDTIIIKRDSFKMTDIKKFNINNDRDDRVSTVTCNKGKTPIESHYLK